MQITKLLNFETKYRNLTTHSSIFFRLVYPLYETEWKKITGCWTFKVNYSGNYSVILVKQLKSLDIGRGIKMKTFCKNQFNLASRTDKMVSGRLKLILNRF